jgi:hypothetical protein
LPTTDALFAEEVQPKVSNLLAAFFDAESGDSSSGDNSPAVPPHGVGRQRRPWAELKEKIILLGRQDGLRWRR